MTADTETIREALEREDELLAPFRTNPAVATDDIAALEHFFAAALAALGRVEEQERALTEALQRIRTNASAQLGSDFTFIVRVADAALAGSVAAGSGEE